MPLKMKIPWQQLSSDALYGLIHERVTRDGTDYGAVECSLEQKYSQLLNMIKNKEAVILYDEESQRCEIVPVANVTD